MQSFIAGVPSRPCMHDHHCLLASTLAVKMVCVCVVGMTRRHFCLSISVQINLQCSFSHVGLPHQLDSAEEDKGEGHSSVGHRGMRICWLWLLQCSKCTLRMR